jgi:hypothetical protein
MRHTERCAVNVDSECGVCSCGAEAEASRDAEVVRLREAVRLLRAALAGAVDCICGDTPHQQAILAQSTKALRATE